MLRRQGCYVPANSRCLFARSVLCACYASGSQLSSGTGLVLYLQCMLRLSSAAACMVTDRNTQHAHSSCSCKCSNCKTLHHTAWWILSSDGYVGASRDTPAFTPGPGTYKAASGFSRRPAKRSWHMQGHPKTKAALPNAPHLPPSVPSKAQSYGYVVSAVASLMCAADLLKVPCKTCMIHPEEFKQPCPSLICCFLCDSRPKV